jgi:hypothetical protein
MPTAGSSPPATTGSSSLLVGVSQTSDPTGAWNLYRIDDIPTNTLWYDFPSVGFTKDWIVVQANIFTISSPTFTDSYVYAFDKANLYAGGAGSYRVFALGTTRGATQVPALTYDNTQGTAYLVNNWNCPAGVIQIHTITGPVGSETYALGNQVVSPVNWNASGPDAPQAGLSNLIDSGDARMQKVVYRNGAL